MTLACDMSMPRTKVCPRRAAYWWTEEIAALRRVSVHARRAYTRARRRGNAARTQEAWKESRTTRDFLRTAIRRFNARAWDELILFLDGDLWGRLYKIVREKLHRWAPPITETLDPPFLEEILTALFSTKEYEGEPIPLKEPPMWDEEYGIIQGEIGEAVKRLGTRKAPGPDSIPGKA
ncbi:reverse transcriptase [Lasius niger]|uniref:Reverse transcriptase n=1 Tax=Lasius niger TaxID=67767 RepID=A0A0J7KUI7_LASNI|nr:reverse transcriptase [Lasius niger]